MFQSSLSSASFTSSASPEGTADVPTSTPQVSLAIEMAWSMALCVMPTFVFSLPSGP